MKTKVKFELKENVKPVFKPNRKVPFVALEPVNEEVERLEKLGVILKINYSDWASPTVFLKEKNLKKLQVCADFSIGVMDCLKDHSYPLLSPEDIFVKLNGGKVFSKIDLSDAYFQMEVEDKCSKVLTIKTHKGLYKLNRFPFGLKVTPSLFQQVMDTMLTGLDFTIGYLDDISIKSENNHKHCDHIKKSVQKDQ